MSAAIKLPEFEEPPKPGGGGGGSGSGGRRRGLIPSANVSLQLDTEENLVGSRVDIGGLVVVVLEAEFTDMIICQQTGDLKYNHKITKVAMR